MVRILSFACVLVSLITFAFRADAAPEPPPAKQIAGKVVDDDGNPVAGATIKDLWTDAHVQSDKDGHFVLTKISTVPKPIVAVNKPGYAQYVGIQEPGDEDVTLTLSNKTWIQGRVLSSEGKPVADALIRADSGRIDQNGYVMTSVWTETRSDKDGNFKFYLTPVKFDVQVRVPKVGASRFELTVLNGDNKTQDIQLEKGITFVAHCIDSETNEPVAGVKLSSWQHKGIEGTSDEKGVLTIEGMQPGEFAFDVQCKDYAQWWSSEAIKAWEQMRNTEDRMGNWDSLEYNLQSDMAPVTITLEKGVTITGKILDPDDKPVAGATAAPARTGSGNSITGDTRFSVRTKKDGSFVMTLPSNMGRGDYNLIAHDGKYGQWRKWGNGVGEPFNLKPGEKIENVTMKLTAPATFKGRVIDSVGNPAPNIEVRAMMTDGRDNRYYVPTTKTDKDGKYELKFIRPGEAMVQAEPFWLDPKQAPAGTSQIIEATAGETKDLEDLTTKK